MVKENKNLFGVVLAFWDEYLNFKDIPNKWEVVIITHNPTSWIPENEFFITEFPDSWIVISVHDNYVQEIRALIGEKWYDFEILKSRFEQLTRWEAKILGPVVTMSIKGFDKLLPMSPNAIRLEPEDEKKFHDFMESCTDSEAKEVNMEFGNPTHFFYALYQEWIIVSLANYSVDDKNRIGHIWIITPFRFSWKGYGKQLVNTVIRQIIDSWLAPQYRASSTNIASLKIAESLWFERVLESFSFIPA